MTPNDIITFKPEEDDMEIRIYGKQDKKGNFDINIKANSRTAKYIESLDLLEILKHIEKMMKI